MVSDVISAVIAAVISNYLITSFVLGLLIAAIKIARWKGARTAAVVSGYFLNEYIFWALGIGYVVNFIMHSFFGDYAAKTIGWAQSPFQLELAFFSLGFAVVCFVTYGRGVQLRAKVGVVCATVVFGVGAAGGHIFQMVVNDDYSADNTGLFLIANVVMMLVGVAFLVWHAIARRREVEHATDADLDARITETAR